MTELLKKTIKKAPQNPGIYIFKNKIGEILYIGKAGNLRNRVRQYLKPEAERLYLKHLLNEAGKIEFKTADSEIEALIFESKLIKEKQPKYNIMLRDGKQYFYVIFTNEKFPKIFLTHQPNAKYQSIEVSNFVGPFTDGTALKATLKFLRRIFPYCTCKQKHNNFCLNYHIGKCLGYCCLKQPELSIKYKILDIYKKNIKAIKDILSGKRKSLISKLKKEMNNLTDGQEFEKAIELRNKIGRLEKIFANAKIILNTEYLTPDTENAAKTKNVLEKLAKIFKLPALPSRIEGYDISNIQGQNAVGAMAVFIDGQPDKNEYRKFKIYFRKTPDDTAMLKEVLIRRFNHPEWPYPDLIFIDGGKGQLNAARAAISEKIPILSLAKGKNEVFSTTLNPPANEQPAGEPIPMKKLPREVQNLILYIDSEAHRFAISYYRKLHRKRNLE